jgi:hypothetical protein
MDVDLKHFRGLYILENNPHPPSRGDNSLSFGGKITYVKMEEENVKEKGENLRP